VHQIWVPLKNVRFLLLLTNLAREWLHIITSTADELSVGANIDDLERPWTTKICFSECFAILCCGADLESKFSLKLLEIDQDNLRT